VERHWKSFDQDVTNKEFRDLPIDDLIGLFEAMKLFRYDLGIGYVIKNYGDGLMMIKAKHGQGRCLFFTIVEVIGTQELIVLTSYKKETQNLPDSVKRLAVQRMRLYLERKQ
jgi:phage-related protein